MHVGSAGTRWSEVFRRIESLKAAGYIVDYSVSQTTLEQIFLNFSKGNKVQRNLTGRTKQGSAMDQLV